MDSKIKQIIRSQVVEIKHCLLNSDYRQCLTGELLMFSNLRFNCSLLQSEVQMQEFPFWKVIKR